MDLLRGVRAARAAGAVLVITSGVGYADSANLTPKKAWMGDFGLGMTPSGFDVLSDGRMVAIDGTDVNLYAADGSLEKKLTEFASGYGAWVRVDPDEQTAWFGHTTNGNTDDRIYSVPLSADFSQTDEKVHQATLPGNYEAEFASIAGQDTLLVAGLNSSDWMDPHAIWLLDTSGSNNHDMLVELGGWSVGFAVDLGNNIVSTSALTNTMYRFEEADWLTAVGVGALTTADGSALADLAAGNGDVAVDDAGNIFFNMNGAASELAIIEAGKDYSGYGPQAYDVIAEGDGLYGNYFTNVDAEGDLVDWLTPGRGYTADFYYTDVCYVPEPGTLGLMALALVSNVIRRRGVWR